MRLADVRTRYREGVLELDALHPDPLQQFEAWLAEALGTGLLEPNAMTLATIDEHGAPSARMVLLKGIEAGRLVWYTNLESSKSTHLRRDPRAALTFWWDALERQVRIEGVAEPMPAAAADAYFASRPRESQLGAWCSPQSRVIAGREVLSEAYAAALERFPDQVERPPFWGGWALTPHAFEFWQGRASRLHDRFRASRSADGWSWVRLAP
jgi:pyridoxamine 5'-phosphate oxidase